MLPAEQFLILIQVIIITIFIPVAIFFLLRSMGLIETVMASKVAERRIPLIAQIPLLFLLTQQSITAERLPELHFFFLGALLSTVLALLAAFSNFKISLHMMGMGALLLFTIALSIHLQENYLIAIALLMLLTGIVGSSRLHMGAHSMKELFAGFLCGMLPQLLWWRFWL